MTEQSTFGCISKEAFEKYLRYRVKQAMKPLSIERLFPHLALGAEPLDTAESSCDTPPAIAVLKGMTLTRIEGGVGDEILFFHTSDNRVFRLFGCLDGCGNDVDVSVQDICGDLGDLIGSPILLAEEVCSENWETDCPAHPDPQYQCHGIPISYTWTFYKLSTIKGSVTIRWLGESNGYYSERVEFDEITGREERYWDVE